MMNYKEKQERLFPVLDVHELINVPDAIFDAIKSFTTRHEEAWGKVSWWARELYAASMKLKNEGHFASKIDITQSIIDWLNNEDHGAYHSFCVAEGGMSLAEKEDSIDLDKEENFESRLEMQAVLHDFARFLPAREIVSGDAFPDLEAQKYPMHAYTIGYLVICFGEKLGFSPEEVHQFANNLSYHDFSYENRSPEEIEQILPYIDNVGRILHDADKLFGYGTSTDPKDLVQNAIERNRRGARTGKDAANGWYLLRDLSPEQRKNWKYGDRWWMDRVSAVRKDMFDIPFLTQAGQETAQERRKIFIESMKKAYEEELQLTQQAIIKWESVLSVDSARVEMSYVGYKQTEEKIVFTGEEDVTEFISQVIHTAFGKEMSIDGLTTKNGKTAQGWNIRLFIDNQEEIIIDPSIARFLVPYRNSEGAFLQALVHAFTDQEEV